MAYRGHGSDGLGSDGHGSDGHGSDGHGSDGLGLALSRRLLAVADGTIRAEPAPLGAVLTLTLAAA